MAQKDPGVFIGITDENVASLETASRIIIFGIKTTGSLAVDTPLRIRSPEEGIEAAGRGSQLAQMISYCFDQYRQADITAMAMIAPVSTAAAGSITFGGAATTARPVILQVEDQTITVPVAIGDDGTAIALAADTVLNDGTHDDLHVTGTAALAVLDLDAKSHGAHGDQVRFRVVAPLPPGVTAVEVAMTGGAGAPDLATAIAAVPGTRYKYWVVPDTDATNLTALVAELDDRWTAANQNDGLAQAGLRGTVSAMATFADGEDTKHLSVICDPYVPSNPWAQAAVIIGQRASVDNPKFTLYNDNLTATLAPDDTEYLTPADRNTLLEAGASTYHFVSGRTRVNRHVTLAKTNTLGQPSEAYYDVETRLTVAEMRQSQLRVLQPEIGKVLVNKASDVQYDITTAEQIIDANGIRQILINQNDEEFEPAAWTDNSDFFEENLQVSRTGQNEVTIITVPPITGTNYVNLGTIAFVFSFGTE